MFVDELLAATAAQIEHGWCPEALTAWGRKFNDAGRPREWMKVLDEALWHERKPVDPRFPAKQGWRLCVCIAGGIYRAIGLSGTSPVPFMYARVPHPPVIREAMAALNAQLPSAFREASRTTRSNLVLWQARNKRTKAEVLQLITTAREAIRV